MARPSVEPARRRDLMNAAIKAIHQRGSLDVTMSEIAGYAGVSPALAHHYFGGKDQLIVATMRYLLAELHKDTLARLREAGLPRARISAIVAACFGPEQFERETVSTWLTFYHYAQSSEPAARLLRVYFNRLNSNLAAELRQLTSAENARDMAQTIAALIDGLYLRQGLGDQAPSRRRVVELVEAHVDTHLAGAAD